MVETDVDMTLAVFSADTTFRTVNAKETQCKIEFSLSRNSEDGGKPHRSLWKLGADQGGTQKSRVRRAKIDPLSVGSLTYLTVQTLEFYNVFLMKKQISHHIVHTTISSIYVLSK